MLFEISVDTVEKQKLEASCSRKKKLQSSLTSTLTARSKAACGLNYKLIPKKQTLTLKMSIMSCSCRIWGRHLQIPQTRRVKSGAARIPKECVEVEFPVILGEWWDRKVISVL